MAREDTSILWINNHSGSINQATAPHLVADNQFKLLVNCDQIEIGAIAHRLGTERYLELVSGAGLVQGLHMYEKANGNRYLHMVEGGNLQRADEVNSEWDVQESAVWDSASKVDMVNYINRHYMIGSGSTEYLRYATEAGNTTVVSGNIAGSYLAANGPYLMVVDPATQKAQWSEPTSDTFDAADYASINGFATGVGAFGVGRPFVVFTRNNYIVVDPANVNVQEVTGFGCVSHRSIQTVRGYMIFLGRDGFYMLGYNDAFPVEISRMIRNPWSMDAIFNRIANGNWEVTASGTIDNRYFCALKDLSANVKGYDLNDVVVEYDIAQQTVKMHTFETGGIGSVFAQWIDTNGELGLYAGSYDTKAVYKMNVAAKFTDADSTDADSAVTARAITKDFGFYNANKGVVVEQDVIALHFRYQASAEITIKYSIDGKITYSEFPATLPTTSADYAWEDAELPFTFERGKTISLDLSCTGKFIIYGIGFEITETPSSGITLI